MAEAVAHHWFRPAPEKPGQKSCAAATPSAAAADEVPRAANDAASRADGAPSVVDAVTGGVDSGDPPSIEPPPPPRASPVAVPPPPRSWFLAATPGAAASPVAAPPQRCECRGRCPAHRAARMARRRAALRSGGADAEDIYFCLNSVPEDERVAGTRVCDTCRCTFPGCRRPLYDSTVGCAKCMRMLDTMDESLQCAFRTRKCIERFLPCDVTAYDVAYPQLGGDFAWEVFFALVKEPLPTQLLLDAIKQPAAGQGQLRRGQGYVRYGMIFVSVCRAMNGVRTPEVWKTLNGPGKVACFMGFVYSLPAQHRRGINCLPCRSVRRP